MLRFGIDKTLTRPSRRYTVTKAYLSSLSSLTTTKPTLNESKKTISELEASRVRDVQKYENLQLNRRRLYEKLSLSSYLNVCVDTGQINRAFNTVLKLSGQRNNQLVDIEHYNIILRGWGKLASTAQILETRMHMIRHNIEPNASSFAYILLAYTKQSESMKAAIKRTYKDMQSRNIDLSKLFQSTYLSPSERNHVRNVIKRCDPNYEDKFFKEPIEYDCKLLKNLPDTERVPFDFTGMNKDDLAKLESWADNQRSVEYKASISIKSVANIKDNDKRLIQYSQVWSKLVDMWRTTLSNALDESLLILQKQSEDASKIHLYPYLCSIDKEMLINLMLDEIETNAGFTSYSTSTSLLHVQFGQKVMLRYLRSKSINDGSYGERQKVYNEYLREYCINPDLVSQLSPREFIQRKAIETKNYAIYKDRINHVEVWPHHTVIAVGRFLYGLILREIKFDPGIVKNPKRDINMKNLVHAFYTAYFQVGHTHKIKEEFRAHQDFERLQQKSGVVRMRVDYSFLPSASPPLPWLSHNFGGYLTNKAELVRVANPFAEKSHVNSKIINRQKLYPSLDSLNAIGLCPWIVNKEILDLIIKLFQSGGDSTLSVPLDELKMVSRMPQLPDNPSKAERILHNREKKKYEQKRREMYSLWRDCLYRLSIANHFRDKVFWFPHNMDFRGRTYPIPPHFNHLGADLARSLLLFAKGRPLGEKGLDWLKIHLINLVGMMKKNSLAERLEYANSILHVEVLDSADNPWDGRRWWTNNENPWQVLACCKEIAKAIRSKDHKQYISHFPVHQDGSCNGLQHYAALGRDPAGAMAVNLVPCDMPQDVYSRVVELVEAMRQEDAKQGVKMALMLDGFIQRKVIKQTVMTTVYGVTKYGARQQIARQLAAKGYNEHEVWQAAQYLSTKTFESIGQMFNKSRVIQDWLNECAYIIASKCRQPVSWETPLGFLVSQPYVLPTVTSINRLLSGSIGCSAPLYDPLARINSSKQKTAFPPNYIHSLDSSHMMLTSLHCHRRAITFVSVHDCYWTHPSSVDQMNEICRQQFIALHSEPLLQDLSNQLMRKFAHHFERLNPTPKQRISKEGGDAKNVNRTGGDTTRSLIEEYKTCEADSRERTMARIMDVPSRGNLDLNVIQNSTYFFS